MKFLYILMKETLKMAVCTWRYACLDKFWYLEYVANLTREHAVKSFFFLNL